MLFHKSAGILGFALTCLSSLHPASVRAALPLAERGEPRAAIVANGHNARAEALGTYLERIVGNAFPVVESLEAVPEGLTPIVLSVADTIPGLSDRRAAMQGYRIHTGDGRLHLTGRTEQGLTYAVYGFLDDHLGVRFFTPGFETVPPHPTLVLEPLDDLQEPAFLARAFSQPYGHPLAREEPLYREKNRGNTPRIVAHHNYYQWIPPGEYFENHPEWYPLVDGERRRHHTMPLCGTNEELARTLADKFMAQMESMAAGERGGIGRIGAFEGIPPLFSAGQGDGFLRCECPDCRGIVDREGTEAAPYLTMLNRAMDIASERYPDHAVITYAYFGTLKAPKTLRPHPNLWINIVSSSLSPYPAGDQLGPIRDNPRNRDYREAIKTWPKLAPGRVSIWDWTGNFTDATIEWPNLLNVADNIRFFHENDITAVFLEQPGGEQNWGWLRKWVWARMLWNPAHDPETLMKEFITAYYGPLAAPFIREYHRYVARVARDSHYGSATVRWTAFPALIRRKLFTDVHLHAMTALLDGALEAATGETDPVFQSRVRQAIGTSVDTLLLSDAGRPTRVRDPRDDSLWLVPGGRPDFPERIDRVADAWLNTTASGAESWHHRYRFLQRTGGRMQPIANDQLALELLPSVRGQIYSLVHQPTGRELLAPGGDMQAGGYTDRLPGATTTIGWEEQDYHQHWLGEALDSNLPDSLTLHGVPITSPWHTPRGLLSRRQRYQLQRVMTLSPDDGSLRIERRYLGRRIRPSEQVFEAAWSLAVPNPSRAHLTIREGDTEHRFDLSRLQDKVAEGGAGDRPIAFSDVSLQEFDFVEGQALNLEIDAREGDVSIVLERGDGLTVDLRTPAAETRTVALTPVLGEHRFTIVLGTRPMPIPADDDNAELVLPQQTLRVSVSEDLPDETEPRISRNPIDGAEMVWVPAGPFWMGSPAGEGNPDETPQRRIELDGYRIYRHPVTVAQYRAFGEATGHAMPNLPKGSDGDDHPMFNVTWHDAAAYAAWARAALPTEAQWEKAARGTDGRIYPWGDAWEPDRCVSYESTHGALRYGTRPVGSHPEGASPYGVLDMAGQVWEWTADWYAPDAYRRMFERNPTGPDRGEMKVLRGGSLNWNEWHSRVTQRTPNPPHAMGWVWTGFRLVVPNEK